MHASGLKYGMYSDAGSKTCLGLPGSRGNEELDAQYFADLGVDFLKYDNCHAPASDWIVDRYSAMRDALNKTGRPILFSMCNWGAGDPWKWAQQVHVITTGLLFSMRKFPDTCCCFCCHVHASMQDSTYWLRVGAASCCGNGTAWRPAQHIYRWNKHMGSSRSDNLLQASALAFATSLCSSGVPTPI